MSSRRNYFINQKLDLDISIRWSFISATEKEFTVGVERMELACSAPQSLLRIKVSE